jgi:hypothetical protein
MKAINTYVLEFKSGRIEKVFAKDLKELRLMVTWGNVSKYTKINF